MKPPLNNCKELIRGRLQAKWEIQGENLIVELFGRIREDEYMAFGLSGHAGRSQMVMYQIFYSMEYPMVNFSFGFRLVPMWWSHITIESRKCFEPTITSFRI